MALNNYANLVASIRSWSKRADLTDLEIDDFIDICESAMYSNIDEPLEIRGNETRATASTSITTRYMQLPTGFLNMRSMHIVGDDYQCDVRYQTPEMLVIYDAEGRPDRFTITNQIELNRVSDQVYTIEMNYYAKSTALSASNTTNTVLTNYPHIYLFGALWAMAMFSRQEELSRYYYDSFIGAIRGANKRDRDGRYGPAPVMRIEGDTP